MEIKEKIGENVKKLREYNNLTQETLAEISDLHPTYISLIERGKKACSVKTLDRIASALNISTAKILNDVDKIKKVKVKKEDEILRKINSLLSKRSDKNKKACLQIIKTFLKSLES